ncbi:MAG: NAD(P)-dependent oxidoreductase [Chloroflexi bacterium]|nr:NAD(P)-dependent oxidoreductase [Chloroflexota bacterium]MBI3732318.1 NAD(P)-dependent oxidoreductase [Chloroflexota bacterium]
MRIVVTGGAGFLGYHIANQLAGRAQIHLLDIDTFHPEDYPAGVSWAHTDVRNPALVEQGLRGADVVVHAAAGLPLWKPQDIREININGARNVLEAAKRLGIPRVVHISSTAVYGVPEKHPLYETDPMIGVGPYGISKIEAEKVCGEYRAQGLIVPILRPKTFVGTGRLGVFQILFDWVYNGKRIPVIGNGRNRYQLLEVSDLVEAIWLAATAPPDKANDTFNVGAKRLETVNECVGALCEFAGNGARVLPTPAGPIKFALSVFEALGISPLYKWVYGTADKDSFVSIEKIENQLGWEPKFSNSEALIKAYRWYLEHHREVENQTGVTHRVPWNQGILKVFKRWL